MERLDKLCLRWRGIDRQPAEISGGGGGRSLSCSGIIDADADDNDDETPLAPFREAWRLFRS